MSAPWYYRLADKTHGPLTARQLREMADAGDIPRHALIRKGHEGKWVAAERVSGLFDQAQPAQRLPDTTNRVIDQPSAGLVALECTTCGAKLSVNAADDAYTCRYCGTSHQRTAAGTQGPTPQSLQIMARRAIERGEYGKAMQFIEEALAIDPHDSDLLTLEEQVRHKLASLADSHISDMADELAQIQDLEEAEQYCLKAEFILHELQANVEVYGSNSAFSGATPADVDLALQYINRSLELFPDNTKYLNLKALFLWEGKGQKDAAASLLERAAALNPRDITIQHNLKRLKSSPCFIATAAFGTPCAAEVDSLRVWRDERLASSAIGRLVIAIYGHVSPPIARFIAPRPQIQRLVRWFLTRFVRTITRTGPCRDPQKPA